MKRRNFRFLGRLLKPDPIGGWSTSHDGLSPVIALGQAVDGSWFALATFRESSLSVRYKPSRRAAVAGLSGKVRLLYNELGSLEILPGLPALDRAPAEGRLSQLPTAEEFYVSLESAHPTKAIALIAEFEARVRADERSKNVDERYRELAAAALRVLEVAREAHDIARDASRDEDPVGWDEEEVSILRRHKTLADLLGVECPAPRERAESDCGVCGESDAWVTNVGPRCSHHLEES